MTQPVASYDEWVDECVTLIYVQFATFPGGLGEDLAIETILLITENPTVRETVCQALFLVDYPPVVVVGGCEAIAQAKAHVPLLILLDDGLEDGDAKARSGGCLRGLDLCSQLRQHPSLETVPIIFLQSLEANPTFDKDVGFSQGVSEYLSKPLHPQELRRRVDTWLSLHHLEQQTHCQNQRLQQTDQSLKMLLHAVSHDLRQPFLGMQMVFQHLLQGTCPAPCSQEETISVPRSFLLRMMQGSDRHLSLIDTLIDTHSHTCRPLTLNIQPVDVSQLFPTVLCEMTPWLQSNQATLSQQIPADLPPLAADPVQLCRVLKYVMENALKHNPPGIHLQMSVMREGDRLCFVVQDNGVGIPPSQQEELFGLFQRGNQVRLTHGLGLGLCLCQQIVQAHGGEISVGNRPEGGARVWFALPIQEETR